MLSLKLLVFFLSSHTVFSQSLVKKGTSTVLRATGFRSGSAGATDDNRKLSLARTLQVWLEANGGFVHPRVSAGYTNAMGYDLRSTGIIREGEVICAIPENVYVRKCNEFLH